jgi:hypothetical protein
MAVLFFAIAMGAGTFIESKYNTDTARIMIYNAWWFEAIMVVFVINFIGNIKRYHCLKKKNGPLYCCICLGFYHFRSICNPIY